MVYRSFSNLRAKRNELKPSIGKEQIYSATQLQFILTPISIERQNQKHNLKQNVFIHNARQNHAHTHTHTHRLFNWIE